jgi:hypothetical protein
VPAIGRNDAAIGECTVVHDFADDLDVADAFYFLPRDMGSPFVLYAGGT